MLGRKEEICEKFKRTADKRNAFGEAIVDMKEETNTQVARISTEKWNAEVAVLKRAFDQERKDRWMSEMDTAEKNAFFRFGLGEGKEEAEE